MDTVITAWKQGASPEEIVDNFDTLKLADVYNVISYYLAHRSEVDEYLEQNRLAGEQIRAKIQPSPQTEIRECLLTRRATCLAAK